MAGELHKSDALFPCLTRKDDPRAGMYIGGGPPIEGGPPLEGVPPLDGGLPLEGGPPFDGGPPIEGGLPLEGGPPLDGGPGGGINEWREMAQFPPQVPEVFPEHAIVQDVDMPWEIAWSKLVPPQHSD